MKRHIVTLEETLHIHADPGKQEIRGGGVMTLNAKGEVTQIDAKLGDYVLSEQEIQKTLLVLKRQGVQLENVSLITYDKTSQLATQHNADQDLIDKYRATQVKTTDLVTTTTHEAVPQESPESIMARYKSATMHQTAQQPGQSSVDSDEEQQVLPSSLSKRT